MDHRSFDREPSFFRPSLVTSPSVEKSYNPGVIATTGIGARVPPPAHGGSVGKRHGTNTSASSSTPFVDHRSLTPDTSRMGKDPPVAAGLWRPPSLSPKHHQSSSSVYAGTRPMDGRTSAPPAAHQSSSPSPAAAHHLLPTIGHLPPPLPPPHLQRISSPSSSSSSSNIHHAARSRPQNVDHHHASPSRKDGGRSCSSNSVSKGSPVGVGILRSDPQVTRQQQVHPKEFVTTSSPLIQSSSPSHHIYSPIPGYSVNGHLTSGVGPLRTNGSSVTNGPPGMMTIPPPQQGAIASKSSFMSVDSLISNSSSSNPRSSAQQEELGHLKQVPTTATSGGKSADSSSKQQQAEMSGSQWSPSNNNRTLYSPARLPMPGFGPPGVVALSGHVLQSGGMVIPPQSSSSSSQFQSLPQYHGHPLNKSSPSTSGSNAGIPLTTPPVAHQTSCLPGSQGINNSSNIGKPVPLISSIGNSGRSHSSSKTAKSSKSISQSSSNEGQRAPVLSFPPGHLSRFDLPPHGLPSGPHATPTTIHLQSIHPYYQSQGVHPVQQLHPQHHIQTSRPLPEGRNSSHHNSHHNLLPGSSSASTTIHQLHSTAKGIHQLHSNTKGIHQLHSTTKGGPFCDNNSFTSLSNPHHLLVNRSVNNNGNYNSQNSLQCHDSILFDARKKEGGGRKSESGSMNENSCDNQIPSTSVSPTNSNHSSHSNSGPAKSLKKFWVQKYQDTNAAGGNGNDVTTCTSDVTPSTLLPRPICDATNISPGNKSTLTSPGGVKDNPSDGKEGSKNGKKSKALKTMKSGVKGSSSQIDSSGEATGSESDRMSSGTEMVGKKKVKKRKDDPESSITNTKSGTKRPGKDQVGKKVGGKKKKVDEKEGESDSSIQEASVGKKKKGVEEKNEGDKKSQQQQVMDSEMTDVEEEESSRSGSNGGEGAVKAGTTVPGKRGRKPKKGKVEKDNNSCEEEGGGKDSKVKGSSKMSTSGSTTTGSEGIGDTTTGSNKQQGSSGKKMREKYTAELMMNKSGQPFLQSKSCSEIAPTKSTILTRCRECKMTPYQKLKKEVGPSIFCRFYQFRKLFFHKELRAAGFSEPFDAKEEDFKLWIPADPSKESLKKKDAEFLIDFVSDHFCNLVTQERKALSIHKGPSDSVIAWKSVVAGVREMCDVCDTTLFNIHWVCSECGFVVCIDCYKSRLDEDSSSSPSKEGRGNESSPVNERASSSSSKDRDKFNWLLCNSRQAHSQEKLMLTQIIAKSALWEVCLRLHHVKKVFLKKECKCPNDVPSLLKLIKAQSVLNSTKQNGTPNGSGVTCLKLEATTSGTGTASPLSFLADVAINSSEKAAIGDTSSAASTTTTDDDEEKHFSALRELLSKPAPPSSSERKGKKGKKSSQQILHATQLNGVLKHDTDGDEESSKLSFFTRKITPIFTSKNLPPRVCTIEETEKLFPDIPHDWVCDGRLLVLKDTGIDKNLLLFEQQWLRHQPVVVCKVQDWLEKHYWTPNVFKNKFAEAKYDLIDSETHDVIKDQPLKKYWDGFENLKNRPKGKHGKYVTYKLKDWPPGEEFSEALPEQYRDLMSCIPLPEYTTHEGVRNLAARLPRSFGLIPDLGPKMYTAYGLASDEMGTTNLHLDVSDAVNVMVYVGVLKSKEDEKEHQKSVMKALEEAGVEKAQMKRTKEKKERVGALWHIYDARDADKIRDMLNHVSVERGIKLEKHHDPIHDQSFYLDKNLRDRLKKDYGVEGYQIVQFYGDSVFIPAGAPHQVRNLSSCIKVAEDFVSPENVAHCFNLTEEFRQLSGSHENHEDKLQIKNIIYHTIKDALAPYPYKGMDHSEESPIKEVKKEESLETENKV